jgi:hypothetical protein
MPALAPRRAYQSRRVTPLQPDITADCRNIYDVQKNTLSLDEDFTKSSHKDKLEVRGAGPCGWAVSQIKLFPTQGML